MYSFKTSQALFSSSPQNKNVSEKVIITPNHLLTEKPFKDLTLQELWEISQDVPNVTVFIKKAVRTDSTILQSVLSQCIDITNAGCAKLYTKFKVTTIVELKKNFFTHTPMVHILNRSATLPRNTPETERFAKRRKMEEAVVTTKLSLFTLEKIHKIIINNNEIAILLVKKMREIGKILNIDLTLDEDIDTTINLLFEYLFVFQKITGKEVILEELNLLTVDAAVKKYGDFYRRTFSAVEITRVLTEDNESHDEKLARQKFEAFCALTVLQLWERISLFSETNENLNFDINKFLDQYGVSKDIFDVIVLAACNLSDDSNSTTKQVQKINDLSYQAFYFFTKQDLLTNVTDVNRTLGSLLAVEFEKGIIVEETLARENGISSTADPSQAGVFSLLNKNNQKKKTNHFLDTVISIPGKKSP